MAFSNDLLSDKTILITGAGKGIGRECALIASACGAKVIAVARTEADLLSLEKDAPNTIEPWVFDVADSAFHKKIRELTQLDGLVNNAGTNRVAPMHQQTDENIDDVIDLNIRSLYKVAQAALTPMLANKSGAIVNMSSVAGLIGTPGAIAYGASKGAVRQMTKSVAIDCAKKGLGIRCNSVHPGVIVTNMGDQVMGMGNGNVDANWEARLSLVPMGEPGQAVDVANCILFLASDEARHITGAELVVDGGMTAI